MISYEKNDTSGVTTVAKHFYANGLQVAKMVGSTVYYLHQDALGSTRLVATASVTIKFSSNYVPYGSNYAATGREVFMYTGKPYDSATGLYYYGARYYDQTTGRFVTQDSYSGDQEDPQSLNRYAYARDNPMSITDTNGHWWNPFAAVTSAVSTAVTAVTTTVTGAASAVTNAWNSMPPSQQQAIIVTGLVVAAAAVTVLTAGAAAPTLVAAISLGATSTAGGAAIGAAASAVAYTTLAGPKATPVGVLANAAVGTLGGGVSTFARAAIGPVTSVMGATAQVTTGLASSFANQALNSAMGKPVAPAGLVVLSGSAFGFASGAISSVSDSALGNGASSAVISAGTTAFAQTYVESQAGISPIVIGVRLLGIL